MMLSDRLGGDALKVPLARAWRVAIYRERRMTLSQTALRLGLTEGAVSELRRVRLPAKLKTAVASLAGDAMHAAEATY
jgi:hypothetical protein